MRRHTKRTFLGLLALSLLPCATAAIEATQLLILVNKDTAISSQVAKMYQAARGIPAANVLSLSLGSDRYITSEQYWKSAPAIRKALEANPAIRCILTTSGVPYLIHAADNTEAAFDSELAAILLENPGDQKRHQPNPLFLQGLNAAGVTDPRTLKMVFVARLDGPDLKTITRMVQDAVAVEKTGLEGPVFGDSQGMDTVTDYGIGDMMIRGAIDRFSGAGFPATLDTNHDSWKQPAGGVGSQAAGAAFYLGWYDLRNFQDIFGQRGLARGSIAWHLASLEAQNLWDPTSKGWAVNLMLRGAAVTLGPVFEPYLDAFPRGDVFIEALMGGRTVVESYWLALPHTSWAMVLIGDPLYAPFSVKPRPTLVARAYTAENTSHILLAGQSSGLLVQIECVGPAGSATLALTATVQPELGVTAASGQVSIPALKAGESTIVRIPSVTAGGGLFRVALVAQDDQKAFRRIVLEGRTGMSRLTAGVLPKSQLFASADGNSLVSGQPGRSFQIDTATLRTQVMAFPQGYGLVGAEYSPNGGLLAASLVSPQTQKGGAIILNPKNGTTQSLPPASQFLRWMRNDQVLLKQGDQLVRHSLAGGADLILGKVPGCLNPVAVSVVSSSDVQYVTTADGKSCIQKGSEAPREVMQGVSPVRFGAIADDLSLLGGVDAEKRLWIQHGLDGKPEMVASGVEHVLWGPISRRALVLDVNRKGRVYDGRDRSWTDLGTIAAAQWSPDETRLLFLDSGTNFLSVLTGKRIEQVIPSNVLGPLAASSLTMAGDKAFLLSGIGGGMDVWMVALPPTAPGK